LKKETSRWLAVLSSGCPMIARQKLSPSMVHGTVPDVSSCHAPDARDAGAVAALAGQCCRLPLALRVAAELAAARPQAPLAGLVGELAGQQRRLGLLDAGGDPRTAVGAVFSWSYRRLDPAAARVFRLAGLHPGADLTPSLRSAGSACAKASLRRPAAISKGAWPGTGR
jgi:hypothetical protein